MSWGLLFGISVLFVAYALFFDWRGVLEGIPSCQ